MSVLSSLTTQFLNIVADRNGESRSNLAGRLDTSKSGSLEWGELKAFIRTEAKKGYLVGHVLQGRFNLKEFYGAAQGLNLQSHVLGIEDYLNGSTADVSAKPQPGLNRGDVDITPAGQGKTLPEKAANRHSSKWRVRAASGQRSIFQ